ncbi:hypothetical protein N9N67_07355 [Bacteriovoracaceae bacterium]|nr:hypothetical protein [Bacteriovoracaceae bacterium]
MKDIARFITTNFEETIQLNELELLKVKNQLKQLQELVPKNSRIVLNIKTKNKTMLNGSIEINCQDLQFSTKEIEGDSLNHLLELLDEGIKSKILAWSSNRVFSTYIGDYK